LIQKAAQEPTVNGREELHAFVDGELDRAEAVKFAAKVAASPVLAREVARLRGDKELLARVYGGIADQPIPDRLRAPFRRRRARRRTLQIASGIGLAAAFSLMLWLTPPANRDRLVDEALSARSGGLAAERVVAADSFASPDLRDQLVAETLALPVKVPDLASAGYSLAAIALYKQAAQISYKNAAGLLFTLYLRHPVGPDRFDMRAKGKTEICVWENAELAVAMVGEMSGKDMLKLAAATYADLNL
jgi:anti-sigma factor RsiW